ncbi:hypothetical protein BKA65DRAFT_461616 [Rhexocercosporidium sp. MPI-PUGE-AT-0058]|nr:hypothetical protein BKA65DRAFT_461616 [Rhexocercosporidium sp. MPI-PUGE-AT-0058]
MVLKRKRSDSEISTSSSLLSSPLSASGYMSIDYPSTQSSIPTPSLFSSRTRKRYRDNRPSESEVHQHTLSLLFSGAQKPQQAAALPTSFRSSMTTQDPVSSLPSTTGSQSSSSQQASLHSFWHGPMASGTRQSSPSSNYSNSSANTPSTASQMNTFFPATNCEDCDVSLGQDADAMDVDMMMDIDMGGAGSHACTACGKQVCHSCAVSNLGSERKCLNCAGRNKVAPQVGGAFGWVRAC